MRHILNMLVKFNRKQKYKKAVKNPKTFDDYVFFFENFLFRKESKIKKFVFSKFIP